MVSGHRRAAAWRASSAHTARNSLHSAAGRRACVSLPAIGAGACSNAPARNMRGALALNGVKADDNVLTVKA